MIGVFEGQLFQEKSLGFWMSILVVLLCCFIGTEGRASHYESMEDSSLKDTKQQLPSSTYGFRAFDPESDYNIMRTAFASASPVECEMFLPPHYPHMCALLSFLDLHDVPVHPIAFHQSHSSVQAFEWIDVFTDENNTFLGSTLTGKTKVSPNAVTVAFYIHPHMRNQGLGSKMLALKRESLAKKLHQPLVQLTIRNEAAARGGLDILRLRQDLLRQENRVSLWCLLNSIGITRTIKSFDHIVLETPLYNIPAVIISARHFLYKGIAHMVSDCDSLKDIVRQSTKDGNLEALRVEYQSRFPDCDQDQMWKNLANLVNTCLVFSCEKTEATPEFLEDNGGEARPIISLFNKLMSHKESIGESMEILGVERARLIFALQNLLVSEPSKYVISD